MKKAIQILIILLFLDALWVFFSLCLGWATWPYIALYWAILTAKNGADYIASKTLDAPKTRINKRKDKPS